MDWWGDEESDGFFLQVFTRLSFTVSGLAQIVRALLGSIVLVHRPEMDNPAASIFIWKQSTHQR